MISAAYPAIFYMAGSPAFRIISAFSPSRAARMQTALVRLLSMLHLYGPLKGAADRLAMLSPHMPAATKR